MNVLKFRPQVAGAVVTELQSRPDQVPALTRPQPSSGVSQSAKIALEQNP